MQGSLNAQQKGVKTPSVKSSFIIGKNMQGGPSETDPVYATHTSLRKL